MDRSTRHDRSPRTRLRKATRRALQELARLAAGEESVEVGVHVNYVIFSAGDGWLRTIEKVGRAASRDESRPVLTGVLVRFEGDRLIMAATDSYRLAVKETVLTEVSPELDAYSTTDAGRG